jgi:formylglycine-generating enzyme required for sulfatase activity
VPEAVEPVLEPDGIDAVRVAGGSFVQGATRDHIEMVASRICSQYPDSWCRIESFEDELPRSEVDEPNAEIDYIASRDADVATFYIDRYEVTNARYAGCVEAGVCDTPQGQGPNPRHDYFDQAEAADLPVIYVSWEDATDYCHWAGGRLPTAAEWEKAARGTDGRTWPWGDDFPSSRVNYRQPGQTAATEDDTRIRGGDPAAGGAYTDDISPYEVHDMAGNVMEWVSSWYGPGRRELRGGSWNTGSFSTRASSRVGTDPDEAYFDVGFRCAYNELP